MKPDVPIAAAATDTHGIRAVDVVDFEYPYWHTGEDTIDKISAGSLGVVGDVAMALIRTGG